MRQFDQMPEGLVDLVVVPGIGRQAHVDGEVAGADEDAVEVRHREDIFRRRQSLCAVAFGLLVPKLVLGALAKRLRKRTDEELPLLVDLLRLLQGVGFSVDQSLQMIGDRFQHVMPVLSREVRDANANYVRGRSRLQSLHRLTEFGNEGLQGLVQLIVQVHEHGGAVQEPLRQFADRLREQRKLRMKEQSGKLSVKMTVVMMLTLLPALMLVLAGPAVISLVGTVAKMKGH